MQSGAYLFVIKYDRLFIKTYHLLNTPFRVLVIEKMFNIFDSVFHRILDFKTGLDFYLGPFFFNFTSLRLIKRIQA